MGAMNALSLPKRTDGCSRTSRTNWSHRANRCYGSTGATGAAGRRKQYRCNRFYLDQQVQRVLFSRSDRSNRNYRTYRNIRACGIATKTGATDSKLGQFGVQRVLVVQDLTETNIVPPRSHRRMGFEGQRVQ